MSLSRVWVVCLALCLVPALASAGEFSISSSAFGAKGEIPMKYTCEGKNVSPPLAWADLPAGTKSLALIVEDPDAPDPAKPKMVWEHWLLYDIPPSVKGLAEGVGAKGMPAAAAAKALPKGTRQAKTSWKKTGYGGPCPPTGRHRYFFKLYALDALLGDLKEPDKKSLLEALKGHLLGKAELVATYQKKKKKK